MSESTKRTRRTNSETKQAQDTKATPIRYKCVDPIFAPRCVAGSADSEQRTYPSLAHCRAACGLGKDVAAHAESFLGREAATALRGTSRSLRGTYPAYANPESWRVIVVGNYGTLPEHMYPGYMDKVRPRDMALFASTWALDYLLSGYCDVPWGSRPYHRFSRHAAEKIPVPPKAQREHQVALGSEVSEACARRLLSWLQEPVLPGYNFYDDSVLLRDFDPALQPGSVDYSVVDYAARLPSGQMVQSMPSTVFDSSTVQRRDIYLYGVMELYASLETLGDLEDGAPFGEDSD